MRTRKNVLFIVLLALIVLSLRLYLSFQTDTFTYESYFHIRQIEHIQERGVPLFQDPLAHGGTTLLFSPLFHYLFAFLSFLFPLPLVLKIAPQLLFVCVSVIIYFLAKKLVDNELLAALAAAFAAFSPFFFRSTISSVTPLSLFLPLLLLLFYFFVDLHKSSNLKRVLVLIVFLAFISPLSLFLIPLFWFYLLLLKLEKIPEREREFEVILFTTFFILLVQLVIYKKALFAHGTMVLFKNLPLTVSLNAFSATNVLHVIYSLGLIPFLFGLVTVYFFSFVEKKPAMSLLISFVSLSAFLLWAKLLELSIGILFLGIGMSVLAAASIHTFFSYLQKTIAAKYDSLLIFLIFLIFLFTSFVPAFFLQQTPLLSQEEHLALVWMQANIPADKIILAHPRNGFAIEAVAKRKVFLDENYLLLKHSDIFYQDMISAFTTRFETEAVALFDRYGIDYIYFSSSAKEETGLSEIRYISDSRCFQKIYDKGGIIYQIKCNLQ